MPVRLARARQAGAVSHCRRLSRAVTAVAITVGLALGGCTAAPTGPRPETTGLDEAWQRLGELTTASAGSMRGYSRQRFPHWRDIGPNCDVRDAVLRRDGAGIKTYGCNVVDGRWLSVYDNRTLSDPADVDVDHMVPLANAWRSGADEWTDARRGDFANDLTRPQLIAVSASSNRAKGDQDPSQWKPPNRDAWCQYAKDWVEVKYFWRLSVTTRERAALADMLETCEWWIKV
ncbi:MAG TPA: HNH endonuclease family protein [Micromonosporaceae bacterium]|nr:HNH endonuclease family protein [Micromonosporaceae bacterium]